jgi:Glycosyl Hydrolase Family 88.
MKNKIISTFLLTTFLFLSICCTNNEKEDVKIDVNKEISYCASQATKTLAMVSSPDQIPNNVDKDSDVWHFTKPGSWTSGFWPGILWLLYEDTKNASWKEVAEEVTQTIMPMTHKKAHSHDSGFIAMTSFGNAYRLTGNKEYKDAMLRAADSLSVLYNPLVGTILSWPGMVKRENWPHNTIIDNMMNLELLLWASKNGGEKKLYDIAVKHADTTMQYGFRNDFTNYHVAVYDTLTGEFIKGVTHQGYTDDSMWARGQAWAIYGYTMMYRETKELRYLDFAQKVADVYLSRLPEDLIPYWDFKAFDKTGNEPRDASAAAISASALLELSTYITHEQNKEYLRKAKLMLAELSSERYQSRNTNTAFLLHSVGHRPRGTEIDASIIYTDYYYLEALIRLKHLQKGNSIHTPL